MSLKTSDWLLDNMSTAVLLLDNRLCIQNMNAAAHMLFATNDARSQGLALEQLICDAHGLLDILHKALKQHTPYIQRDAHLYLLGQQQMIVDLSISPVCLERAPDVHLLLEIQKRDRLQQINQEEKWQSQQQITHSFLRGLAHEIKNPLGGIRGAAQLLGRALNTKSHQEYTDVIIAEADRLRHLLDRMLLPNKKPHMQTVNIHAVLERVCQIMRAENHFAIHIVRDYDPSIPELTGDTNQLIQAVLNMSLNAKQAMQEARVKQPILRFKTRIVRQFTLNHQTHRLVLRLDIIDNGTGIAEHIKPQLFYPMISTRAQGSGLGLAISQSIVSQFGGIIEFANLERGAMFSIYLPLNQRTEKP